MLAADTVVAFRLGVADPFTLQPISEIRAGETFALVAYVQDKREVPQGVFSAYLDVRFPTAAFDIAGAIRPLGGFVNGLSGTAGSGLIDELGGFSEYTRPPGGAEQILAAIPMTAREPGEFSITADPADIAIGHEVLVYGLNQALSTDVLEFRPLTTKVLPGTGTGTRLDAVDDEFFLPSTATLTLDVLANDTAPSKPSVTIFNVDNTGTVGKARLSNDRRGIQYEPATGFSGVDVFRYSVVDDRADLDTAIVTVHVENGAVTDKRAEFQVVTTDRAGRPISSVSEGDEFLIRVFASDTRSDPKGVFAGYLDLSYSAQLAHVTGPLEFSGTFTNGISGNRFVTGLIDEAGGFTSQLAPPGGGAFLVFQVPMKAAGTGQVVVRSGPADTLPDHQILLFGDDSPLDPARVAYGTAELTIHPAVVSVDDTFDISGTGGPVVLDVLANDRSSSGDLPSITQVDVAGMKGTVSVTGNGRSIVYTPSTDSRGTEQFRYVASNRFGSSTSQVTLHIQPAAPQDDVLSIRLATTDPAGNALNSVAAGAPFQVQAWVRDLRGSDGADRGVYAAYLDLLYEADRAAIVTSPGNPRGIALEFGPQFRNGTSGSASVPGLLNEVGAFQSTEVANGTGEHLLFTATFRANTGRASGDRFGATEDTPMEFDVLANDEPNQGRIQFRSDPADSQPISDVLLFRPAVPVAPSAIRFQSTSIQVNAVPFHVVSTTPSRRGGKVTISTDGQSVRYEPPLNYFGPDDFTYSVGPGSDTVVYVDVSPVNDPPGASSDSYVAGHHEPLRVSAGRGILANDADVDRDVLQAQLVTPPSHGRLELKADGSFEYVPDGNYFGTDQFVYRSSDGKLQSADTPVLIEVAPPAVRIRLETLDSLGRPVEEIRAGESLMIRALVRDMRDLSRSDRGVGAVYFDLQFDPEAVQPRLESSNPLGFDVRFGPSYQNVRRGDIRTAGLVNDVGALQSSFAPLGSSEHEVFSLAFQSLAPQVADDAFRVSMHSTVNVFDVLANENGKAVPIQIRSAESGNSPQADVVLFEPPQPIHREEVGYGSAVVNVRNSSQLVLDSLGTTASGASVSIDPQGRGVRYTPRSDFIGTDTFTYTVRDEQGVRSTGTVTVTVVESWSNEHVLMDANSDSFITPNDVLQIINDLNQRGGRRLPNRHAGTTFFDVNRDGHATAIDALVLINFLARSLNGAAEGEGVGADPASPMMLGLSNETVSPLTEDLSQLLAAGMSHRQGTNSESGRFHQSGLSLPTSRDDVRQNGSSSDVAHPRELEDCPSASRNSTLGYPVDATPLDMLSDDLLENDLFHDATMNLLLAELASLRSAN